MKYDGKAIKFIESIAPELEAGNVVDIDYRQMYKSVSSAKVALMKCIQNRFENRYSVHISGDKVVVALRSKKLDMRCNNRARATRKSAIAEWVYSLGNLGEKSVSVPYSSFGYSKSYNARPYFVKTFPQYDFHISGNELIIERHRVMPITVEQLTRVLPVDATVRFKSASGSLLPSVADIMSYAEGKIPYSKSYVRFVEYPNDNGYPHNEYVVTLEEDFE